MRRRRLTARFWAWLAAETGAFANLPHELDPITYH